VNDYKQVIVVRADLKMGKGKIAVQVAHASILGANEIRKTHPEWYDEWVTSGQKKIVVKVPGLTELLSLKRKAQTSSIPVVVVDDAGLTQLIPGTTTCIALGPSPSTSLDKITGGLSLL
tara:strand:- start:501 stop:857 length:357 start_codon:yes stop_codon:yes gene_type:complete